MAKETAAGVAGIRVQALLECLQDHVLGDGKLTPTQIRAIEMLLRKSEAAAAASAAKTDEEPQFVRFERHIVHPQAADGESVRAPSEAGEGQGSLGREGER